MPGTIDGFKMTNIVNGAWGVAFSGQASPNGALYNSELAEAPLSTGRITQQCLLDIGIHVNYTAPLCGIKLDDPQISPCSGTAFGMPLC